MMGKIIYFFLLIYACILPLKSWTQQTFHKIFDFDDTLGSFSSVREIDSLYLIGGSKGKANRVASVLLKLDLTGNFVGQTCYKDDFRNENLSFSYSTIQKTSGNELWAHYTTRSMPNGWWYPKVLKDIEGNIQSIEFDTLSKLFLQYYDAPKFELFESINKYALIGNYAYFDNLDTLSNLPYDVGAVFMMFEKNTDSLIFLKKFNFSTTMTQKPRRIMRNFLPYHDSTYLLLMNQDQYVPTTYSRLLFYKVNVDGDIIELNYLQDTPFSNMGHGSTFLNNQKDLLISYTSSELITPPNNTAYWGLTPSVARLDSNFNIIWKKELGGVQYNPYQISSKRLINKFALDGDSCAVYGYFRSEWIEQPLTSRDYVRIENRRTADGSLKWERDYWFYPEGTMQNNPAYEIRDVEKTNDGGYIFVGEIFIHDSISAGAPGQLGYVLKTNCLGFLDDPQAGFTTQKNDSLGVYFQNTSLMGGSYLWHFGDGVTLQTGEFDPDLPVYHQYSDTGLYEVTLIAYGCNGANDTTKITVHVTKTASEEPVNPNITNYMAIGPNPVQSGESIAVYVGNLPSENCTLSFYDEQGKVVLEHRISLSNSTNIIVLPFSAGVYQAVLRDGEKRLEVEKVLVY